MSKSFSIVLNSKNYLTRTNRSSTTFAIDWSFLPDGCKYKMTWRFVSEATQNNYLLMLTMPDIGAVSNAYLAADKTVAATTSVIGLITNWYGGNAAGYFRSDYEENPPLFFNSKPTNNQFLVNIYNNSGVLTDIGVDYMLFLNFEKIDEYQV